MLIVLKYTKLAFLNNIDSHCLEWGSNYFSYLQFKMFQKLGGHIGDQQKSTVKLHLVEQPHYVLCHHKGQILFCSDKQGHPFTCKAIHSIAFLFPRIREEQR